MLVPLPPWRGPLQLLHVGPHGVALDRCLSRLRTPSVQFVDLTEEEHNGGGRMGRRLPLSDLPPKRSEHHVRCVFISDTHGKHRCVTLPVADILVHSGDCLQRYGYLGTRGAGKRGLEDFDAWLGSVPARHRLVVGGNHDCAWEQSTWRPRHADVLDGRAVDVCGLRVFGSPHSPLGVTSNDAFQSTSLGTSHSDKAHALAADGIDVLVTHARSPLFEAVARQARVWAHGHIHSDYGVSPLDASDESGCVRVNCATCDMIYRPANAPVVVDMLPSRRQRRTRPARMMAAEPPEPEEARHVLCLHGGGTNEAVMRMQTAKLRAQLRPKVEFHFLEGHFPTAALDPAVEARFGAAGGEEPSFFSWYDVEVHDRDEGMPFADYIQCLLDDSVEFTYHGVDEALARLENAIDEGTPCGARYDALLGFSQGAVLATLLTALRLGSERPPSWLGVISVAGMPVRADRFRHLFAPAARPLDFPCVLAQGTEDPFYEWCARLYRSDSACWRAPDVIEFAEGHRFPHERASNARLVEGVRRLLWPASASE